MHFDVLNTRHFGAFLWIASEQFEPIFGATSLHAEHFLHTIIMSCQHFHLVAGLKLVAIVGRFLPADVTCSLIGVSFIFSGCARSAIANETLVAYIFLYIVMT